MSGDAELIEPLLTRPKRVAGVVSWQKRTNHAGHLLATGELTELDGTTIPGLTVQFEVKDAASVVSCLYLFSVMRFAARERRPIYQLEVAPATKRTHNGLRTIYGPHEHVGKLEPTPVTDDAVNCESWDACALWFFTRAGIVPFEVPNPFEP